MELSEIAQIICEGMGIILAIEIIMIPIHVLITFIAFKLFKKKEQKQ